MGIKTQGFGELMDSLKSLDERLQNQAFRSALREGAKPVYDNAKNRIHDVTGDLSSSMHIYPVGTRKGSKYINVGVKAKEKSAYYSNPVEFGHGGRAAAPPHPFLLPAFDTQKEEAYDIMRRVLASYIK